MREETVPKGEFNGKLSDSNWRTERARKAAAARMTPAKLISALEERAELLTAEDRQRLAALLESATPPRVVAGITIGG
jgi:hypothetical protein